MEIPSGCRTPGQLLSKLIEQRGWNQRIVAIILDVGESVINKIISGHRSVDAEMAVMFEGLFGVDANEFLELQKSYDLAKARITTSIDPQRATRATLFGDLPVPVMMKRSWLNDVDDIKDTQKVEAALKRFFREENLNDIEVLTHAAKKTNVLEAVTPAQMAWIYRVRQMAEESLVADYSESNARLALKKLEVLMNSPEHLRRVPRILAESGIRYVIVESIGNAKIDGVTFWLDENSPVIGMTLRYDRIDNFWFVLRHEIEHVLREHGRGTNSAVLDAELEGERAGIVNVSEEERQANEAAADFGISRATLQKFITRKSPYFKERDLIGFANTLNIHPGIVAGRLQHELNRYDLFRNHLVKIRSKIVPSAMVDGWGEVAPIGY